jgi:mRNA-degrading endonuclease toxin of MazEF toxin-antitoxin module
MQKDFKKWSKTKQEVHNDRPRIFFNEREVWFSYVGENIGFEQDGRGDEFLRPFVVIKKFNNEVAWVLPLTKNQKKGIYYFQFNLNNLTSTAILSQIRLVDVKRFKYKLGDISERDFIELKTKIRQLLA